MDLHQTFDVIVIGGGHAGVEAALAAARSGADTLLVTQNIETIGQMSCNPAIGGIGKGHLVKEVDALGGVMARAIDVAGIQFRKLNERKGPAVRATRAQADRILYKQAIRVAVETQKHLRTIQQSVDDLILEQDRVAGVITKMGWRIKARAVVLTVGTFLGGLIHVGLTNYQGGRAGDAPSNALAKRLRDLPFRVDRLKTGTPPRIDGRSIDYTELMEQPGDDPTPVFSFLGTRDQHPRQVPCHITYTNENTHAIIQQGLDQSPMYNGKIEGVGPRYCPSIEDKVVRFADKSAHQIFIEPEGLQTHEIYPNGISTSLSFDTQVQFVRSINGFENAHITRPGYAIEYDFFDPRDLKASLETHFINGLFFAGQINGTTGYEEAAAQGLIAGINAARYIAEKPSWTPRRDEAYMGVLIDDLITRGTKEPYRMFTSRAEYRLSLREDNADLRLTETGRQLGLVTDRQWQAFTEKREAIEREKQRLQALWVNPKNARGKAIEEKTGVAVTKDVTAFDLLRREEFSYDSLMKIETLGPGITHPQAIDQIETQAKYAGYLARQDEEIARQRRHEETVLPSPFPFEKISGLSNEVIQKLQDAKPQTIGAASRIPGVTPAAISLLLISLKKREKKTQETA